MTTTQEELLKIKACLFNFIIYVQDVSRIDYFRELAQTVTEKFPCRIVFIQANPKAETGYANTRISTEVHKSGGTEAIVYDQIDIEAGGDFLPRVPFLILPHLVPDLPVYLLWGHDPTIEDSILPHLELFATRLIFDSECTDNLPQFCSRLLNKMKKMKCDLVDMNWARFVGWRNLLAQLFDTRERSEELHNCKLITISYNHKPCSTFYHNETQALYLQSWLATQFSWNFHSVESKEGKTRFLYTSKQRQIIVDLLPKTAEVFTPGSIISFEAATTNNHFYSLTRTPQASQQVRVEISTLEECELPYTYPIAHRTRGYAFVKEILYSPASPHYRAMLHTIAHARAGTKE